MKLRWVSVLAAILLAAQGSIPARAQTRDAIPPVMRHPSHADSLAFGRVSRVGPQTKVRVLGEAGSFEALGAEVTLQGIRRGSGPGEPGGPGPRLVSWSEIQEVRVRGNAAGSGAGIGAVTSGLLGIGLVVIVSTADFGLGQSDDPSFSEAAAVTCGFAAVGAMVGAVIGAAIPRWRTIHSWAGF